MLFSLRILKSIVSSLHTVERNTRNIYPQIEMSKVFNVKHSIYMSQGYLLVLRVSEKASVFSSAEIMRSHSHILRQLTISAELIRPTKC